MSHFDPTETPPGFNPKQWRGICAQKARADIARIVATALAAGVIGAAIMGQGGIAFLCGLASICSLALGVVTLTESEAGALESYLNETDSG